MKLALALLLVAFFAIGAVLHAHWIDRGHRERDAVWGEPLQARPETPAPEPASEIEAGWSLLVVGRPSGRPAVARESGPDNWRDRKASRERADVLPVTTRHAQSAQDPIGSDVSRPPAARAGSEELADFELVISAGQTLSQICEDAYGTSRGGLLQKLALYNGLSTPDKIRTGQRIRIPEKAKLLAAGQ